MTASRKQVLKAYRSILTWVRQENLHPGNRLPPQLVLGKKLGICQGTLSAAMRLLVKDGVLSRKQKSGTTLLSPLPKNPHRSVWTVGIVMPDFGPSGYYSALTMQLHRELASRNFADRTYFISPWSPPGPEVNVRKPSDFISLESDLEEKVIDALITSTRLQCDSVPCVGIGAEALTKARVCMNESYLHEISLLKLHQSGVRKAFLVGVSKEVFKKAEITAAKFSPSMKIHSIAMPSLTEWAADTAARTFLSLDEKGPQSGVIIPDDLMATLFAHKVAKHSNRTPFLCLRTYKGAFLSYPLPTLKFIVDLKTLCSTAVDLLLAILLGDEQKDLEVRLPLLLEDTEWGQADPKNFTGTMVVS